MAREVLLIQLPRGLTAAVRFDPSTGLVTTNHEGMLNTLFHKGVMDWSGRRCFPAAGRAFLSALFDHLFLCGYSVNWLRAVGGSRPTPKPVQ